MEYENESVEQVAANLLKLRACAPYRFGGKWFLATLGTTTYCRRSMASLKAKAAKLGILSFQVATIQ